MKLFLRLLLPTFLASIAPAYAGADVSTGELQAIIGLTSDCTQPSSAVPYVDSFQVSSEFRYLACKTYQTVDHTLTYYRLDYTTDGEYIRLLPRIGHIQFADAPGRHEPGTGRIDLPALFVQLDKLKYRAEPARVLSG